MAEERKVLYRVCTNPVLPPMLLSEAQAESFEGGACCNVERLSPIDVAKRGRRALEARVTAIKALKA